MYLDWSKCAYSNTIQSQKYSEHSEYVVSVVIDKCKN